MSRPGWPWWMVGAALIAVTTEIMAIGNLVSHDGGAFASKVLVFLAATIPAALVFAGLAFRRRQPGTAGATVAVGCLPGCAALLFWWFPPAVIAGLASAVIVGAAVTDAVRNRSV